jgi:hypothetical protein
MPERSRGKVKMLDPRAVAIVPITVALSIWTSLAMGQTLTWTDIDCSQSDILLSRYTKCQLQAATAGNEGRGEFQSQNATYRSADEFVYVFLQKPQIAFASASIKVTPESRETYLSRPSTEAARTGTNFSSTIRLSGGHVKTFSLPPDWKCFSFVKDAPYLGDGVAYFLVGYSCGKAPSSQTDSAMTAFLQKLSVK